MFKVTVEVETVSVGETELANGSVREVRRVDSEFKSRHQAEQFFNQTVIDFEDALKQPEMVMIQVTVTQMQGASGRRLASWDWIKTTTT